MCHEPRPSGDDETTPFPDGFCSLSAFQSLIDWTVSGRVNRVTRNSGAPLALMRETNSMHWLCLLSLMSCFQDDLSEPQDTAHAQVADPFVVLHHDAAKKMVQVLVVGINPPDRPVWRPADTRKLKPDAAPRVMFSLSLVDRPMIREQLETRYAGNDVLFADPADVVVNAIVIDEVTNDILCQLERVGGPKADRKTEAPDESSEPKPSRSPGNTFVFNDSGFNFDFLLAAVPASRIDDDTSDSKPPDSLWDRILAEPGKIRIAIELQVTGRSLTQDYSLEVVKLQRAVDSSKPYSAADLSKVLLKSEAIVDGSKLTLDQSSAVTHDAISRLVSLRILKPVPDSTAKDGYEVDGARLKAMKLKIRGSALIEARRKVRISLDSLQKQAAP